MSSRKFIRMPYLLLFLSCIALLFPTSVATCVHSKVLQNQQLAGIEEVFDSSTQSDNARRLSTENPRGVIIKPVYILKDYGVVSSAKHITLNSTIVPRAIEIVRDLLKVRRPVTSTLYAHRFCESYYPGYGCASYATSTYCGSDDQDFIIPNSDYGVDEWYTSSLTVGGSYPAGTGYPNTDFVAYIQMISTSTCDGSVYAYATACQRDVNDRPTFGRVNVCPSFVPESVPTADPTAINTMVRVLVHELFHAMGFSSSSFPYFRNNNNEPLTPRTPGWPRQIAASRVLKHKCGGATYATLMASSNTVRFYDERGMSCSFLNQQNQWASIPDDFPSHNCVARLVLPASQRLARKYFGCPRSEGLELENHVSPSCFGVGSHLEQRTHSAELMAPEVDIGGHILESLAVMEDSGWYYANWNNTEGLVEGRHFGYLQGCRFAGEEKCIYSVDNVQVTAPHHHYAVTKSGASSARCATHRHFIGYLGAYEYIKDIPAQFRYFENKRYGGSSFADYCLAVVSTQDCKVTPSLPASLHQQFGAKSTCIDILYDSQGKEASTAGCYHTVCVDGVLHLNMSGTLVSCTNSQQQLQVPGSAVNARLVCPDLTNFCSPRNIGMHTNEFPDVDASRFPSASPTVSATPSSTSSASGTPSSSPIPAGALMYTFDLYLPQVSFAQLARNESFAVGKVLNPPAVEHYLEGLCQLMSMSFDEIRLQNVSSPMLFFSRLHDVATSTTYSLRLNRTGYLLLFAQRVEPTPLLPTGASHSTGIMATVAYNPELAVPYFGGTRRLAEYPEAPPELINNRHASTIGQRVEFAQAHLQYYLDELKLLSVAHYLFPLYTFAWPDPNSFNDDDAAAAAVRDAEFQFLDVFLSIDYSNIVLQQSFVQFREDEAVVVDNGPDLATIVPAVIAAVVFTGLIVICIRKRSRKSPPLSSTVKVGNVYAQGV